MTVEEMCKTPSVKINIAAADYGMYVEYPMKWSTPTSAVTPDVGSVLLNFLQSQTKVLSDFALIAKPNTPRFELVKPDPFDGTTSSPDAWLSFYEYACEKNYWIEDDDKIKNMRLFLTGVAKRWYELRISQPSKPWQSWKTSFQQAFRENPVECWDKAIFFKYRGGSLVEYFYEKRGLLHVAEPAMPETSIVSLIIHGLPKDLQRQVQVQSPSTVEGLI